MNEAELRQLITEPEGEGVEFKPTLLSRKEIAEYAVGIGNAGGGLLLMGVSDRLPRRIIPLQVPPMEELARIQESVADSAQIHVQLEVVRIQEGSVLAVKIPPRTRGTPFHTRDGKFLIRLGEGLRGMTMAEIDAIRREAGGEFTASAVSGDPKTLIAASGMEELRRLMVEAAAPAELAKLSDEDLLRSLKILSPKGELLIAGLLLVGKPEAIQEHLPHARWQFRRMKSDTDYDQSDEGLDCFPIALKRLSQYVAANNPVITIPGFLIHPEFPRYPSLALRELLVNAFVHRDYQTPGAVTLKLYPDRLELSNPGAFVGGVTPHNILHHPSVPRYPTLFSALTKMRLANESNLGVPRIFKELLGEGKEPPEYWASGNSVRVTVKGQDARKEFVELVQRYDGIDVDHLLIIHYLTRHREITTSTAARICQRSPDGTRELMSTLLARGGLLEKGGGSGSGRYYRLSRGSYELLLGMLRYQIDRRLSTENMRARILDVLRDKPLSNAEIREITQLGRYAVVNLMNSLEKEGFVRLEGKKRGSRWVLIEKAT